jgi:hypothetical protein
LFLANNGDQISTAIRPDSNASLWKFYAPCADNRIHRFFYLRICPTAGMSDAT